MTDRPRLRIGFVGCGRATERLHLPALRTIAGVEVAGLADLDAARLDRVASTFGVAQRSTDPRSLLEDASIDIVAVCVPALFHADLAIAVLEADKHLFLEKPMALSLPDCDRILEVATRADKKAVVGFNLRCHRLVEEVRGILRERRLGELQALRSQWTSAIRHEMKLPPWRDSREQGGGVLCEIAVHHYDLWCFLLESEVEEIHVVSRGAERPEESAVVTARMKNGVGVTAVFSERTNATNELELFGCEGRLAMSLYRYDGLVTSGALEAPGGVRARLSSLASGLRDLPRGLSIMRRGGDFRMSYGLEWQHFLEAIRNDEPVKCPLEDGRRAVQIMLAASASASRRKPVTVADAPGQLLPD